MPNIHASPADQTSTHHVVLELNGRKWGLKLDKGSNGFAVDERTTESSWGALFSSSAKKYGNDPNLTMFEQREWTDGRGIKNYEDSVKGYYDALAAWSLSPSHLLPCPQWHRATGYRIADQYAPGSMTWYTLTNISRYIKTTFTATAETATHCKMWIRRVGTPGTLTFELHDASSTLETVTKTVADITDFVSEEFDFTFSEALTATTYYLVIYGASSDNATNHWEVGGESGTSNATISSNGTTYAAPQTDFELYFRITGADVAQRAWFFEYSGTWYAVTAPDTGNSQLFSIASTGVATEITGHGLTVVSSRPIVSNDVVYFPQGSATNIRRWNGTTWADDGTNKADFMCLGYDSTDGAQVFKALSGDATVSRADVQDWGTSLTFSTSPIQCGNKTFPITSILWTDTGLRVFKSNGGGIVISDVYTQYSSGASLAPSIRNGLVSVYWNNIVYYSWLNTLMRSYSTTVEDIGQAWKGRGLPEGRLGNFSSVALDSARMFLGVDAGASGTSSVQVFTGTTWMEIFRCPQAGYRVRDVAVQFTEGGNPRVWIDAGGDWFYFDLPKDVASPLYDSTLSFQHEFVLVSSTFDDSTARLPKYVREFSISGSNFNGSTIRAELDYQVDENIGTSYWIHAGNLVKSPEDSIKLHLGNIRSFRFRIRALTDDASTPPIIDASVIDGFTRTPNRKIWNLRVVVGTRNSQGGSDKKAKDLLEWLSLASQYPGSVRMTSIFPELHNRRVIVSPPSVERKHENRVLKVWDGMITISLQDMT